METTVTRTKYCPRCERDLPVTEFGKRKDWVQPYCRECHRAYNRKYLREYRKKNASRNPDEIIVPPEKRCPGCGITRPLSDWSQDSTSPDGLDSHCKPCKSEH